MAVLEETSGDVRSMQRVLCKEIPWIRCGRTVLAPRNALVPPTVAGYGP